MAGVNSNLMQLAKLAVWRQAAHVKQGFQPPEGAAPPPDPAAAAAASGAPMGPPGAVPGMPPGGMPGGAPGQPGAMPPPGGMPMDPSMMGMGGMPPGMPGAPPGGMGQPGMPQAPPKLKPEQYMLMIDYRLYNMQQQLTAILNSLNVQVPAGALVTPPGTVMPIPEAALPGGPNDPTQQPGAQDPAAGGGGGGDSAIPAIDPLQGASPEAAQAQPKMGAALPGDVAEFLKEAQSQVPPGWVVTVVKQAEAPRPAIASVLAPTEKLADVQPIGETFRRDTSPVASRAAAVASLLASRRERAA